MPARYGGGSKATGGCAVESYRDGIWDEAQKLGREKEAAWIDDVGTKEGKRRLD